MEWNSVLSNGVAYPIWLPRKNPRSAGIYLRISRGKHGDELAVARQEKDCIAACERLGWPHRIYRDNDRGATNGKRREHYERLLGDIKSGVIQAVMVWQQDRLFRDPGDAEVFKRIAEPVNVPLLTPGGKKDLAEPTDLYMMRIEVAGAALEIDKMKKRQKAAFTQRAELGRAWWPSRPFGFTIPQRDGTGTQLVEAEAKLIRDAYTGVLAGRSLKSIARDWNTKGVLTPKGNTWTGMAIRQLLLAPRNAGLRAYRGEIVGEAKWPAIVERDVFDGVRAVLSDPGRLTPGAGFGAPRKYLLSGLAVCGRCGRTVSSAIPSNTKRPRPSYVCKHCMGVKRSVTDVDAWVISLVVERLSRPDAIDLLVNAEHADLASLRDRAAALRARQDELAGLFAAGDVTGTQLKTATAALSAQLVEVESKMLDANKSRVFDGLIGVADVAKKFDALDLDRRRAVINALLTVTIMAGQPPRGAFRTDLVPITWK
jgi:site-specific DNA recombinase